MPEKLDILMTYKSLSADDRLVIDAMLTALAAKDQDIETLVSGMIPQHLLERVEKHFGKADESAVMKQIRRAEENRYEEN